MNLLRFLLRGGSALALVLSGISAAHATVISSSTITAFSATPPGSGPYVGNETINSSFTGGVAKVSTSTVTCPAGGGGCSGDAVDFSLTFTATGSTPTWVTMDGTLSGTTSATDQLVNLKVDGVSVTPAPAAHTIAPGAFYDVLVSDLLVPALTNPTTVTGSLDLSLAAGQTLTLPSSFAITINTAPVPPTNTPEPATAGMLGLGLASGALVLRRIRKNAAR